MPLPQLLPVLSAIFLTANQSIQCESSTFPAVIGPEYEPNIFDGRLESYRPYNAGKTAYNQAFVDYPIFYNCIKYVERGCSYIAVYYSQCN